MQVRSELRRLAVRHASGELDAPEYLRARTELIDDITSGRREIVRRIDPPAPDSGRPASARYPRRRRVSRPLAGIAGLALLGLILSAVALRGQLLADDGQWATTPARESSNRFAHPETKAARGGDDLAVATKPGPRSSATRDWFAAQPDDYYTVQIYSSPSRAAALRLTGRFSSLDLRVQRSASHPAIYRVVYGSFASADFAERMSDRIPADLLAVSGAPLVRPFRQLTGAEVLR